MSEVPSMLATGTTCRQPLDAHSVRAGRSLKVTSTESCAAARRPASDLKQIYCRQKVASCFTPCFVRELLAVEHLCSTKIWFVMLCFILQMSGVSCAGYKVKQAVLYSPMSSIQLSSKTTQAGGRTNKQMNTNEK